MNDKIRSYQRVASKYKWDYQNVEHELADNLEELAKLSRTCNRLSAELEGLLSIDSQHSEQQSIDPQRAQSVLWLAASLNEKLVDYRRLYHQQAARVVKLRKKLLQARTRRDKSKDKAQSAVVDFHKQREEKELDEIADRFVGRLHKQNTVAHGNLS